MQSTEHDDFRHLVEQYNRQLMDTYRQATPSSANAPESASWLDAKFPLPDIERDKAAMPIPAETSAAPQFPYTDDDLRGEVPRAEESPAPPTENESAYIGYVRVFAFTGLTAEPIEGAAVTITRPQGNTEELYATTVTNRDGFTPLLPLPSVSPALTLRPDIPHPYISYDIQVNAPGFRPVIYQNVPVYGDNVVTQSAGLLPIIPGQDTPLVIRSGAPQNL